MSDIDGLKCLCEEYACPCHFEMKKLKPERDRLLAEVEKLKKAIFQTGEKFCEMRAERDDLKLQVRDLLVAIKKTLPINDNDECFYCTDGNSPEDGWHNDVDGGNSELCWKNSDYDEMRTLLAKHKTNDPGITPVGAPVSNGPSAPCAQCGCVHKPGTNTLCST